MKLNAIGKICVVLILVLAVVVIRDWQASQQESEDKRTLIDFLDKKPLIIREMNELATDKKFNQAIALGYEQKKFDDFEIKNGIERILGLRQAWLDKSLPVIKAEKQVRLARWEMLAPEYGSRPYLLVTMDNDGSSKSGYAEYLCLSLADVGVRDVDVVVKDHDGLMHNNDKTIGSAYCPE